MPTVTLTFAPHITASAAVLALAAERSTDGLRFRTRNGTLYTVSAGFDWSASVAVDKSL